MWGIAVGELLVLLLLFGMPVVVVVAVVMAAARRKKKRASIDGATAVARLHDLKERGALTEAELVEQKRRLTSH